jgi:hypothetical protein
MTQLKDTSRFTRPNFDRLADGMTLAEVEAVLGPLPEAADTFRTVIWTGYALKPGGRVVISEGKLEIDESKIAKLTKDELLELATSRQDQVTVEPAGAGFWVRLKFKDGKLTEKQQQGLE